jgi:hypothetical protein
MPADLDTENACAFLQQLTGWHSRKEELDVAFLALGYERVNTNSYISYVGHKTKVDVHKNV